MSLLRQNQCSGRQLNFRQDLALIVFLTRLIFFLWVSKESLSLFLEFRCESGEKKREKSDVLFLEKRM